jgi:hypothetical protein
MATLTLVKQNLTEGNDFGSPYARIHALVNFGNPYAALSKASLLTLLNAALAAVRADLSASAIEAVVPSNSQDGLLIVNWDNVNERLEGTVLSDGAAGTASTVPAYEEELAVVPAAHVVTVPAGKILLHAAIKTAGGGGATGPVKIGVNSTPAVSLEGDYDFAAGTLTLLAADDALTVDLGLLDPGTVSVVPTLPALAAASGDMSAAGKSFLCEILVSK